MDNSDDDLTTFLAWTSAEGLLPRMRSDGSFYSVRTGIARRAWLAALESQRTATQIALTRKETK